MTEIFSDGFESGNFNAWTGQVVDSGNTLEVIGGAKHHGDYGAHSVLGAFTSWAYVYKALGASYATLFARLYMKFNNAFNLASGYGVAVMWLGYQDNMIGAIGIKNDAGTYKWCLRYLSSGTTYLDAVLSTPTPTTGAWYCIEEKITVHATQGEARFYLNGTEEITQTGLDNNQYGNVERLKAGHGAVWGGGIFGSHDDYFDCVVVADTGPIGEEAGVIQKSVLGSISAVGSILRGKQLSVQGSITGSGVASVDKGITHIGVAGNVIATGSLIRDKILSVVGSVVAQGSAKKSAIGGALEELLHLGDDVDYR